MMIEISKRLEKKTDILALRPMSKAKIEASKSEPMRSALWWLVSKA